MNDIITFLKTSGISYDEKVKLSSKTWLKTGGTASIWVSPKTIKQLELLLAYCHENTISREVIGHTSNIYYVDSYNPDLIISTSCLRGYSDTDEYLECECGVPVTILSRYAVEKGYIGYSGLVNLPGTVGASICNNSSCFGCSVSEHLIDAEFFNADTGLIEIITPSQLCYSHRNSNIKKGLLKGVILKVRLKKDKGVVEQEIRKADSATELRRRTQEPPAFTLGSMYTDLIERQCIKNKMVRIGGGILRRLHFLNDNNNIKLRLFVWGYKDLIPFVSAKTINTFIWLRDREDKHEKFVRYTEFINKAYVHPILEIEVRQ